MTLCSPFIVVSVHMNLFKILFVINGVDLSVAELETKTEQSNQYIYPCLLYTSDAADE